MSTRKLESKLSISGEKEYKKAISEINSGVRVLNAEMKKVTAEYQDNANSTEALSAKTDVLSRRLDSEKDKVETLRRALDYAVKTHGEGSKQAMEYQKSLHMAEAAVANTEAAIRKNTEALKENNETMAESSKQMEPAGNVLDSITDKFGIKLPDGIKQAANGMGSFSTKTVAAMGAAAAAVTALIKVEEKLRQITLESAAAADELLTLATNTSLSTQTLQEWQYASEFVDVSLETMTGSMRKLIRSMSDARDGTGDVADIFAALGVSVTDADGGLRQAEDVFLDIIDALGEIENSAERDAVSMELFGKSAQDLNSLIAVGSEGLRAYSAEAHEVGAVLADEDVAALGAVDDAQQKLLKTQEAVTKQLSAEYAPYMEDTLKMQAELTKKAGEALAESGMVDSLGSLVVSVFSLLEPLAELGNEILPVLAVPLQTIAGLIAWIADAVNLGIGALTLDFDKMGTALGWNKSKASNLEKWQYGAGYKTEGWGSEYGMWYNPETGLYEGNYTHIHNSAGTQNFPGGITEVGENGPETVILPRGSQILTAQESRMGSGSNIFYVTIDAKSVDEMNKVVNAFNQLSLDARMGRVIG